MKFVLWLFYWPVLKILSFFFFWLPDIQERKMFEKKNWKEPLAASFHKEGKSADLCFEFSSEGEYQQVASLIDDAIAFGKKIELVFFSPSVEKTILELARKHPRQVRYLRYPLITFSLFKRNRSFYQWVTSKKLILVRYDLFPEFLLWSWSRGHELLMVWVTFKKERVKGRSASIMKRLFLAASEKLIFASESDQDMGHKLGHKGQAYDFRIEQIRRRVSLREERFKTSFPQYFELRKNMEKYPREKRLLIGNAWPSDLFLFRRPLEDYFVMVVPHQLSPEILNDFKDALEDLGRETVLISQNSTVPAGNTYLINKKGVLCELYADFGKAYVGGGFEAGVHSVLEPLVAGADIICAGPKNERSTEFDVACSMGRATEVRTPQNFADWLRTDKNKTPSGDKLAAVFERYADYRKDIISC